VIGFFNREIWKGAGHPRRDARRIHLKQLFPPASSQRSSVFSAGSSSSNGANRRLPLLETVIETQKESLATDEAERRPPLTAAVLAADLDVLPDHRSTTHLATVRPASWASRLRSGLAVPSAKTVMLDHLARPGRRASGALGRKLRMS